MISALEHQKVFKSIVYRRNGLSEQVIERLYPLLTRRPPQHLVELKFIDCNMTGSQVALLCDTLTCADSRLRTLALVNAQQTDRSFGRMISWLKDSQYIRNKLLECFQLGHITLLD